MRNYSWTNKPELLRRWDDQVTVQKAKARLIAAALDGSFYPTQGKKTHVGLVTVRKGKDEYESFLMEVRVRTFPHDRYTSSIVEKHVAKDLGKKPTLYCEVFSDGWAVVYRLDVVADMVEWTRIEMAGMTVGKTGARRKKLAARVPYALGKCYYVGDGPEVSERTKQAAGTRPEDRIKSEPLF